MSSSARVAVLLTMLAASAAPLRAPAQSEGQSDQAPQSAGKTVIERLLTGDMSFAAEEPSQEVDGALLLAPTEADALRFELWFLPEDLEKLEAAPEEGVERLAVTGAYSSGDRFAPEGFVIRGGDPTHPYPQGWDGLLLVDATGRASLHDVSRVRYGGGAVNLRDAEARKRFVETARTDGLSAIQSHLLINEGRLDLKPTPNARRFRRRLLFETNDGRLGVWDSSPTALTLYEAAEALAAAENPRMALNLDMGAYDFCERRRSGTAETCGLLARSEIEKLTNLVTITRAVGE